MLAFLLIVGLSFYVMADSLTGMVGDYLFEQRISGDRVNVEKLAVQVAPLLASADMPNLYKILVAAGGEIGGRMLVLDRSGKVQADSYGELNGTRVSYPEVTSVLVKGEPVDYGVHALDSAGSAAPTGLLFARVPGKTWVGYSTAGIISASDNIGVLLLISPVQEMMLNLYRLQDQMILIFIIVAGIALLCSLIFTRVLTRPIAALTRGIQRMSKGDFSARVSTRGSGELKHLAQTFNSMSDKLQTLDQARNQFVSNASHELKTPLATMKILLESLIYQPEMEQGLRTEFMTDINKEIDRLSSIVSDLLTLVQADSHTMKLARENMSLAAIVKETAHRLKTLSDQKGQAVTLALQDDCDMYADKLKLQQVIYNIMENAVKYTQDGGQIRVLLQRTGRDAVLTVQDNGPGIAKENLIHVFDRFYRVDKARSRETGGTGLGLSIARQIVLLHGGSIRAESDEGKGAVFIVELPLHQG
jgi:two-component system, OmpR family, sensor kinase